MSGAPIPIDPKNLTPATAPGDAKLTAKSSEPLNHFEVKEIVPYESLKRKYTTTISGRQLLALEDYARANKVSMGRAIGELVEFRLVQLGHLPEWWFSRKR